MKNQKITKIKGERQSNKFYAYGKKFYPIKNTTRQELINAGIKYLHWQNGDWVCVQQLLKFGRLYGLPFFML